MVAEVVVVVVVLVGVVSNKVSVCGYLYFNSTNFLTKAINRTQFLYYRSHKNFSVWYGDICSGTGIYMWYVG